MRGLKRPGFIIVCPHNLDSSRPRGAGRKLPITRAVKQPNLREIVEAATVLGLAPEEVQKHARPNLHWEKVGSVIMKKNGSKIATLKALAAEIVKARQRAVQQTETRKEKR
ncbi:signal recognition particle protein Srp19 [Candidatus Bathyarchaeota archaeon]|nr:MAG: signal recognition particle protein Srp19 [Candidatus Bathyarchaeota archaeon]